MRGNSIRRLKTRLNANYNTCRLTEENKSYLNGFYCGNETIDQYVKEQALNDSYKGNGVTYLVIDEDNNQLVAFYTLVATAIRSNKDKSQGYSAVEIKLFAVRKEYQDTLYNNLGDIILIAEYILRIMIGDLYIMSVETLGFKYIVLHSVKEAVEFYGRTWFHKMDDYLMFDTYFSKDCVPMYLRLFEED